MIEGLSSALRWRSRKLGDDIVRLARPLDRRTHFYDISEKKIDSKSSVIQFYSSNNNIGNYTPVLGIQQMLAIEPDVYDAHSVPIDFDFINNNYSAAIIGGAGLMHKCFEGFWHDFKKHCKLPFIVWGVGACFERNSEETVVSKSLIRDILSRCDLVNLRDNLTADYYDVPTAFVAPCPTIKWLDSVGGNEGKRKDYLFSSHTDLVSEEESGHVLNIIKNCSRKNRWHYTDNIQRFHFGLNDIVKYRYRLSKVVITTRLHGAIIASGLGIPYIGISWDDKIDAFQGDWGGGVLVNNYDELRDIMQNGVGRVAVPSLRGRHLMDEFGGKAKVWIDDYI